MNKESNQTKIKYNLELILQTTDLPDNFVIDHESRSF